MEKTYVINDKSYLVDYNVSEYSVEFTAYRTYYHDNDILFGEGLQTAMHESREDSVAMITGHVKWDECCNFTFPEQDNLMLHSCDKEDLLNIGLLLGEIHDHCIKNMEK